MKDEVNTGGVWCHEVLEALDDWVDAQLSAEEAESVRQHVRACGRCAAFGARYATLVKAMRSEEPRTGDRPLSPELLQQLKGVVRQR